MNPSDRPDSGITSMQDAALQQRLRRTLGPSEASIEDAGFSANVMARLPAVPETSVPQRIDTFARLGVLGAATGIGLLTVAVGAGDLSGLAMLGQTVADAAMTSVTAIGDTATAAAQGLPLPDTTTTTSTPLQLLAFVASVAALACPWWLEE